MNRSGYAVVGPDGFFDAYTTHPGREQAEHAIEDMGLDDHTIVEVNIATECRWKDVAGSHYLGGCGICYRDDFDYSFCPQCGGKVVIEGAG